MSSPAPLSISLPALRPRVRTACLAAIGILFVAYVATQIVFHSFGLTLGGRLGLVQLFDMRVEQNLPTAVSALFLAASSLLLAVVACRSGQLGSADRPRWMILSLGMLFLALDEAGELHERWSFFIWRFVKTEGALHDAWLIPYGLIVCGLAVYYWPFVKRLPADTRNRFVLAGVVFVGAAVGMELVEGYYESYHGSWLDAVYAIMVGVEETCEMLGIVMFIDALFRHLIVHHGFDRVQFTGQPQPGA